MGWLPIYASKQDLACVLDFLNHSPEIAIITSQGTGAWRAVPTIPELLRGTYCLWHVPSGPLPLIRGVSLQPGQITNPFAGWTEIQSGPDSTQPYFGSYPGVFWLTVKLEEICPNSGVVMVGLSSFSWLGNQYQAIGITSKPETEKFWEKLRFWVKKNAKTVARGFPQPSSYRVWAFSGALSMFNSGAQGSEN